MNFTTKDIKHAIIGGAFAEVAFELYAWLISPIFFSLTLQPAKLVTALTKKFLAIELLYSQAFLIHAFIGTVGFGIFVLLLYKALPLRAWVSGTISGIALWFIAQGILAPAIGRDFMMGFGSYTQSSFIGHVGMGLIIALIIHWLANKKPKT